MGKPELDDFKKYVKEEYKKYQGWFALSFNKELR